MKINTNNIFKKFKNNKYLFIPIIIITALLGIYLGISVFFINHFTFGTYINDIKVSGSSVEDVKKGRVEYRTDSYGNVHALIGKVSFDNEKLLENLNAFVSLIIKSKVNPLHK